MFLIKGDIMQVNFEQLVALGTVIAFLAVIFGFYFNTKNRISTLGDTVKSLKDENDKLKNEMNQFHLAQYNEISTIKSDYTEIKTMLAVMNEGQKNMREMLKDIKTTLGTHIEHDVITEKSK